MNNLKLPKLVVFDMDGLMFDTELIMMEENAAVMAEYGYKQTFEEYCRTIGTGGEEFMRLLHEIYGADYPAEEISDKARVRATERLYREGVPVKKGIRELLQWLYEQGIPCCIATSTDAEHAREYIRMAGLDKYFKFMVAGDEVTRSKPDPEVHEKTCGKAGVLPGDALVLEDSDNGIFAAYNAGVPVICIPDLKQPSEAAAAKTACILPSAFDVIELLKGNI